MLLSSIPACKSTPCTFALPPLHRRRPVRCQSTAESRPEPLPDTHGLPRRQLLECVGAAGLILATPSAAQAKGKDYVSWRDNQDGYSFSYPFGWQEVSVKGQDVVFKDIIEPLESVSVAMSPTDKSTIADFGSPGEVALTLAEKVLASPKQQIKVLAYKENSKDSQVYYEFEFASKAPTYIRHALAVVAVANGKFYTLTTGANEKRWSKVKPRLQEVVQSFSIQPIIPSS